jgi:hypothetical protein
VRCKIISPFINAAIGLSQFQTFSMEKRMTYQEWADKLEAIASYLRSVFPKCLIEKIEDPLRCQLFGKHIFRIEDRSHGIEHLFSFDYDYLAHNTPDEVIYLFEKRNLKNVLKESGRKEVIMTDDGIRVIRR